MSQGLYCLLLSQLRAFLCDLRALLWDNKDPIQSCAFHGFMLIRPLNLRLSGNHPELTTTIGPWVTRRPSNQGSKEVRFSLWLRGKKFRSRIRFLQLSTGKVTPYGHVLYQFGETSYSYVFFLFVVDCCGTNLGITSRLRTSAHPDPLNRSLVWDGGPGPMQATAYTALWLTEMTHFLPIVASSWSGVGFTPTGNIDSGIKEPVFPQKVHVM